MSISIAHPERYDRVWWSNARDRRNLDLETPNEWECLGSGHTPGCEPEYLWGHLKPELREGE